MTEAPVQEASPASSGYGTAVALQLEPTITRSEAEQVVRRRLGGGTAAARLVHHPFWLVEVTARRIPGLLARLRSSRRASAGTPAAEVNPEQTAASTITVMVDAKGGTSFISSVPVVGDRVPTPFALFGEEPAGAVSDTARQLVATALRKRFRLGMSFELSTATPQPIMKPNWVVDATGKDIEATVLVDGFDSSYWVMSAAKLSA
ncbi:hypothetical protein [Brevibacterium gallinarum]|uniref:Uncharacterized protein n=1 Tax=Brevibacterium gallinarum TaxID=2762220 RepID=A0ABR8WZ54_9MICO|nr:hypothetical protein [Brevibacterium gallinarum]MBD8021876.1 hypothetical protein [Brevibacterium gallinarum]